MDELETMRQNSINKLNAMPLTKFKKIVKKGGYFLNVFEGLTETYQDIIIDDIVNKRDQVNAYMYYRYSVNKKKHKDLLDPLVLIYKMHCKVYTPL